MSNNGMPLKSSFKVIKMLYFDNDVAIDTMEN